MQTSVVIPNFNGEHLLKENLPAVLNLGADEVIVVDDGSTDGSVKEIKNQKSKIKITGQNLKLVQNKKNLGFGASVNKGVATAHGDVIILLNTDVKPKGGLLEAIEPHFKDKKVFGVSFSEQQWSWSRGFWKNGFVEHAPGEKTNQTHLTFWVSGGSGAFRKSVWDKLGGFDEVYSPFYWEDIDLCYRAAKRDYKNLWEPKARVVHEHEATIGKYHRRTEINFVQERNQLIFIWKNITSHKLKNEHWRALIARLVKSPGYMKVVIAALARWSYISKARSIEQKEATITDEKIFSEFN